MVLDFAWSLPPSFCKIMDIRKKTGFRLPGYPIHNFNRIIDRYTDLDEKLNLIKCDSHFLHKKKLFLYKEVTL